MAGQKPLIIQLKYIIKYTYLVKLIYEFDNDLKLLLKKKKKSLN